MEGRCRFNNNDNDHRMLDYLAIKMGWTVAECRAECLDSSDCVAFEFNSEPRDGIAANLMAPGLDGPYEYAASLKSRKKEEGWCLPA